MCSNRYPFRDSYFLSAIAASVPGDQNDDDDDCSMLDNSIDGESTTKEPEAEQLSTSQREFCFGTVSV